MIIDGVLVEPGPALLAWLDDGPGLAAHRRRHGPLRRRSAAEVLRAVEATGLRGRGGAAFPFAVKLRTVMESGRRRPVVVVNLSEGEPLSAKDHALSLVAPHLVLDGALSVAAAIGAREVHVALPSDLPGERPGVRRSVLAALAERDDADAVRCHGASARFVAGQEQAVLELVSGRENLPVSARRPAAAAGVRGRPTLLSNAETWARLGLLLQDGVRAYRRLGTDGEPGSTLLTVTAPGRPRVVREAAYGEPFVGVVPELASAVDTELVLLGGFHGTWVRRDVLAGAPMSVDRLRALGASLGAGVVHLPAAGQCPVTRTTEIVHLLAAESAGRCGPCLFGLPALAAALGRLAGGVAAHTEVERLAALVSGRGACAHPDGTVRMVHSLFVALPQEVAAHRRGTCLAAPAADTSHAVAS